MYFGKTNTTLLQNSTDVCMDVQLPASYAFLDIAINVFGLPIIGRQLWKTLKAEMVDILQLNLTIFQMFNIIGLLINLAITNFWPFFILLSRKVLLVFILQGGPLILCCICLERYVAVIHPTYYHRLKTKRFRVKGSVAVWVIMALSFPLCLSGSVINDIYRKFVACSFFLTVLVMMWCNYRIMFALAKTSPGRDELHPMKVKAFNTVRIISVTVVCFYFPAGIIITVLSVGYVFMETGCLMIPVCITLCSFASIVHPVLKICKPEAVYPLKVFKRIC